MFTQQCFLQFAQGFNYKNAKDNKCEMGFATFGHHCSQTDLNQMTQFYPNYIHIVNDVSVQDIKDS